MRSFHRILACESIIGAIVLALAGCQKGPSMTETHRERPAPASVISEKTETTKLPSSTTFPLEVTDGLQRKLTVPRIPQRIVSLAPKNTEMLFAVGAGEQIVGTTTYCNYPPAAKQIEKVGGFSSKSLSLEKIVSLKPDIVVSAGELHSPIIHELERLGLPVLALSADSFAGLYEELQLIGRITAHENEAADLTGKLKARVERIQKSAAEIPTRDRVTVYYHVWGEPLTAAGPTSYLGEMIQICGGANVIDNTSTRFPTLTMEVLLARNPDVIVSSTNHAEQFTLDSLQSRPGWSSLKAIKTARIHLLDGDLVSRCGPRLVDAIENMAHALYPDHFAAPGIGTTTSDDVNGTQP